MSGQITVPTPGSVLQGPILSDFVPQLNLLSGVTNAAGAVVTTMTPHGYTTGMVIRVFVPPSYGMNLYQQANISVSSPTTFLTDIDTSNLLPYVTPSTYPPLGFTPAQCIPMTGTEMNIA